MIWRSSNKLCESTSASHCADSDKMVSPPESRQTSEPRVDSNGIATLAHLFAFPSFPAMTDKSLSICRVREKLSKLPISNSSNGRTRTMSGIKFVGMRDEKDPRNALRERINLEFQRAPC